MLAKSLKIEGKNIFSQAKKTPTSNAKSAFFGSIVLTLGKLRLLSRLA